MHINIAKVNFKSIGINIAKVDFGLYDVTKPRLDGFYITPAGENIVIKVTPNSNYYTLHGKYLKYSFDGKTWNDWNGDVTIWPGEKMYVKGEDDYVWTDSTNGKLITSTSHYNVGGDISSLTNFNTEVKEYTFYNLFLNDSYIKDAGNLILPATTLASNCYNRMFQKCSSLTTAPALPATTLASNCYRSMFAVCTSLTTAPELPATTLVDYCYQAMFIGCSSLTTAPELPATTLGPFCCQQMFYNCTSLKTAPALPATTLADSCCSYMFWGCKSLTTAPTLPATKLVSSCYQNMFRSCTSLNSITMLATDISASNCLNRWVNGVASTGTFTKAASMTSLPTGESGIPSGWTVVNK